MPPNTNDNSNLAEENKKSSPPIRLLSARGEISESGSYIVVNGEVRNISSNKIDDLKVIISHYDANGNLITSDDSYIEYTPLMPGQLSPFKVMTSRNPLMKSFKIGFKKTLGEEINYEDSRTSPKTPPNKSKK